MDDQIQKSWNRGVDTVCTWCSISVPPLFLFLFFGVPSPPPPPFFRQRLCFRCVALVRKLAGSGSFSPFHTGAICTHYFWSREQLKQAALEACTCSLSRASWRGRKAVDKGLLLVLLPPPPLSSSSPPPSSFAPPPSPFALPSPFPSLLVSSPSA